MRQAAEAASAYLHLPARHEVCTLTDALKDPLQLGVNERIIWKNGGTVQNQAPSVPLILLFPLGAPWMLSICPIFSAAPRTLHSVSTIRSALASDRRGESSRALVSGKDSRRREMWADLLGKQTEPFVKAGNAGNDLTRGVRTPEAYLPSFCPPAIVSPLLRWCRSPVPLPVLQSQKSG